MSKVRDYDQFQLRLPDGLRDEIKAAALANDRSMNAEIIARLQQGNILQSNIESLRDQFAGQALAGLYASRELQLAVIHDSRSDVFENNMARQAYRQADAMLAIRKAGAE